MKKNDDIFILGAGITGLSAGISTGYPIFEAKDIPGGICNSYYVRPGFSERLMRPPKDGGAYRFEIGGGHWIFGVDKTILKFLNRFCDLDRYERRSSVYLKDKSLFIPYPIQNNAILLGTEVLKKIKQDHVCNGQALTMKDWLENSFGSTLCKIFFNPFHNLYTSGLYTKISPQDKYKSPSSEKQVVQKRTVNVGYNSTFFYPKEGLDFLVAELAGSCRINFGKRVAKIDVNRRTLYFDDRTKIGYRQLISTLPLNQMIDLANIKLKSKVDPYTSVLVLNIGARKGKNCPDAHWVYLPKSKSGFFRVGFYSNVTKSFLPANLRNSNNFVSIYVEKSYPGGKIPTVSDQEKYSKMVVKELQELGFIEYPQVLDRSWVEVAYTWSWPNNKWREKAIEQLKVRNILQIGRYGSWKFQGIADSIRDGLSCKGAID